MNGPYNIPQPIPYQGSKRRIAPAILQHFPRTISRLVEPFAGSPAISFAVVAGSNCEHFWINDAHSALIEFWQEVLQNCKEDDLVYMDPPYQGVCGQRDQRFVSETLYATGVVRATSASVHELRASVTRTRAASYNPANNTGRPWNEIIQEWAEYLRSARDNEGNYN